MLPKKVPKHYWSLENNTIDLAFSQKLALFVTDATNAAKSQVILQGTKD
jgi:hypothetical protein